MCVKPACVDPFVNCLRSSVQGCPLRTESLCMWRVADGTVVMK